MRVPVVLGRLVPLPLARAASGLTIPGSEDALGALLPAPLAAGAPMPRGALEGSPAPAQAALERPEALGAA